jgi:NADPH:quinone reductase-like Zn-dependent oxidoreductase
VELAPEPREEVDRDGPGYDVVVDTAGNRPISLLRRAMTKHGELLIVGGDGGGAITGGFERRLLAGAVSGFVSQRISGVIATVRTESLQELTRLVEAGSLRPVVGATLPLADTADAVRAIGTHHTTGKLVITIP